MSGWSSAERRSIPCSMVLTSRTCTRSRCEGYVSEAQGLRLLRVALLRGCCCRHPLLQLLVVKVVLRLARVVLIVPVARTLNHLTTSRTALWRLPSLSL